MPIVLAVGLAIGALNGLLIILLRVPPVVVDALHVLRRCIGVDLRVAPNPKYLGERLDPRPGGLGRRRIPGALFTIGVPDRGLGRRSG